MNDYAIRIENLSKRYKIGRRISKENLTETLTADLKHLAGSVRSLVTSETIDAARSANRNVWALKDVSFDIQPGESIGIIGSNGAGKTTLLKIISQVTTPTAGKVILNGNVGSLLEVGTGFHTELTGRENIYLNGAILGMRRREIDRKFDEIVEFAGVGRFLDTPVKFYSSGMRVRLAFSVAAHLEPDILLVDEVLAVGDIAFQKKSLNKMESVVKGGRTVLFVSHNMATIKALCQKAAYIEEGHLRYFGPVDDAIAAYLAQGETQKQTSFTREADPSLPAQVIAARLLTAEGADETHFAHDQEFSVEAVFQVHTPTYRMFFGFDIVNSDLDVLLTSYDFEQDAERITN
jgi:lipopolysaccharide transport system ATP-binding protein